MKSLARLAPALALFSCAPKATVVEQPAPTPKKKVAPQSEAPVLIVSPPTNDGIRLPDMVTMPSDNELRATKPGQPETPSGNGAVIARPPKDAAPQPQESE